METQTVKLSFFEKFKDEIQQAGSTKDIYAVLRTLIVDTAFWYVILSVVAVTYLFALSALPLANKFVIAALVLLLGFPSMYGLVFVIYRLGLQLKSFKRRLAIEKDLPDYLRLVAINHRSGLSLEEALLRSNRKGFGLLSTEIEVVLKESRVSGDLAGALEDFGRRFNSKLLDQTFKSLALSFRNGSNISQVLDDIVDNINNMRLLQRELVANVKNYIIFILVAGLLIMPFMLALSATMNQTVTDIKQDFRGIDLSESQLSMLNLGAEGGASPQNYLVYVIFLLVTNSLFVALLLSAIKYGNLKQNFSQIPWYLLVSFAVYFITLFGLTIFI